MPKARQIFGYLHCLRDCCGGAAGMDRRASFICTITKMTLHQGSKNLTSLYHMLFPNKKGSAACLNPVFGQGSIVSYVITQSGQKHRRTQDIQRQKQHKNNKLYKDVRAVLLCNVKFSIFRTGFGATCLRLLWQNLYKNFTNRLTACFRQRPASNVYGIQVLENAHKKRTLLTFTVKQSPVIFTSGGTEGTRTLDLRRDRPAL